MKTKNFNLFSMIWVMTLIIGSYSCSSGGQAISIDSLEKTVASAKAGDTIVIANGTYTDVNIQLKGTGSKDAPIVIMAQTSGQVIISGNSSLRFGGDYIEVSGLLFKDGYTSRSSVIEFRVGDNISKGCRFTNNAIIAYNPKDKWDGYRWISLSGKDNRIDHNSFVGKLNSEVVIAVDMANEESLEPGHIIDYNYFGARQMLGSNGGETIRVGNSGVSMLPCRTVIENNYFEECDGEVEVVSLKSCDNIVRGNVFRRCAGVLALRHGDRNIIDGNLFDGDGKASTGGIRVVGADHVITNNVFYKLTGVRFFSALALMNAVPNSTPNRYVHVKNVDFKNNSFYDCSNIEFGTGSDSERTLAPADIRITDNAIFGNGKHAAYYNRSDMSDIKFTNNITEQTTTAPLKGLSAGKLKITEHQGIKIASSLDGTAGVTEIKDFISRDKTGARWYEAQDLNQKILSGTTTTIVSGQNTLADAVASAASGDVIVLSQEGEYLNDKTIVVDKYLIIKAAEGLASRPELRYNSKKGGAIMMIDDGGNLDISGIAFNGDGFMGTSTPNAGIATNQPMIQPFDLRVDNCAFYSFFSTPYSCIRVYKGAFANSIKVENSIFYDCSSDAINLSNEKDDLGRYSAELVEVYNTVFFRMMAGALNVYRGGNDESTSGPTVLMSGCSFVDTNNREQGSVVRLIGVQKAHISDCIFSNSGSGGASIRFEEMRWDDIQMSGINLWKSGRVDTFWGVPVKNQTSIDPKFKDIEALDFSITSASGLYNKKIGANINAI